MRRVSQLLLVVALLLGSVAVSPGTGVLGSGPERQPALQATADPSWPRIFFPILSRQIGGQVTDMNGKPVKGVSIVDQDGNSYITDAYGSYVVEGLGIGSYAFAPQKDDQVFFPSMSTVNLPGSFRPLDFKAFQQCPNYVINESFEADQTWQFPATEFTAAYTTAAAHTGVRSARTGITNAAQNKYSYSSTRQPILIPAGTTSAILRMWLYPTSSDTSTLAMPSLPMKGLEGAEMDTEALGSDGQYVLVTNVYNQYTGVTDPYDPDSGELLQTLMWMRSNDQQWGLYEFNLSKYASPSQDVWIKVQAGTYNDGVGGVTSMYVDDVTLELCDAAAAPQPPTPPVQGCSNVFVNSDFELVDRGWSIPVTAFSARLSSKQYISPVQSMRTGRIDAAYAAPYSYSDAWQLATIPAGATSAMLNMSVFHQSTGYLTEAAAPEAPPPVGIKFTDLALSSDMSYVLVLDQYGNILEWLYRRYSDNGQVWTPLSFDLTKYAGDTIRIQFGTFNNGVSGDTAMFVDDATFDICTGTAPVPTPTPIPPTPVPTPLPGTCTEAFANNSFETDGSWGIPVTVFSAGYSTDAAHTGVRSMRNGVPYYVMDRYSYSDAYQLASMPLTVNTATVGMWLYPISGETTSVGTPGRDVQYVLVLDSSGNWIDTLMWQRKNYQAWTYYTFDVSKWIGTTIRLQFGVYNNGYGGATSMYVDDASLQLCP